MYHESTFQLLFLLRHIMWMLKLGVWASNLIDDVYALNLSLHATRNFSS
jgi:hypothetical protein